MVKAGADYEGGAPPSPELMAAVGSLAEKELSSGRWSMGGLLPGAFGAKVHLGLGTPCMLNTLHQ